MKKLILLSLLVVCGLVLLSSCEDAVRRTKTIRVYKASGDGYTEIVTDENGETIGETNFSEDGVIQDSTEYDPRTGKTIKTEYENGIPVKRTTTNKEGKVIKEEIFEDGRVVEETTYAGGNPFKRKTKRYEYDGKGRITKVDELTGMDEGVGKTTTYEYDEKGRLRKVSRHGSGDEWDFIEYDEEGNVIKRIGNTDGIVDERVREQVRESTGVDPGGSGTNTHVTRDHLGNKIKVTHNSDGSIDVEARDRYGRLLSLQHYPSGPCYLGDECPFR